MLHIAKGFTERNILFLEREEYIAGHLKFHRLRYVIYRGLYCRTLQNPTKAIKVAYSNYTLQDIASGSTDNNMLFGERGVNCSIVRNPKRL